MISTTPVRGAGRPQGVFVMERMMDRLAQSLGLDPAEVRRRNFITPGADALQGRYHLSRRAPGHL